MTDRIPLSITTSRELADLIVALATVQIDSANDPAYKAGFLDGLAAIARARGLVVSAVERPELRRLNGGQ